MLSKLSSILEKENWMNRTRRVTFLPPMNLILRFTVALLFGVRLDGAESNRWQVVRDIEYARVGEQVLKLDVHRPDGKVRAPLIVWVHGGAWRSGSKKD